VPGAAHGSLTVATTFYAFEGVMASGRWTYYGAAACSYDFDLGTVLRFLDEGRTVTCEDRGALGGMAVDIFDPAGWTTVAPWGRYREVEVVVP